MHYTCPHVRNNGAYKTATGSTASLEQIFAGPGASQAAVTQGITWTRLAVCIIALLINADGR